MEEGIQKNQSLEGERRKRGGSAENFSEAADFVANRFRRRPTSEQATGTQSEKDRSKRQPRFRQRRSDDTLSCTSMAVCMVLGVLRRSLF